jgi:hypothetical protein
VHTSVHTTNVAVLANCRACVREDRTPERRVFPGFSPDVAKNVMARACNAGRDRPSPPAPPSPPDASVQIGRGVPVTQVAAQLGHSKKSLTLQTYSHVLIGE